MCIRDRASIAHILNIRDTYKVPVWLGETGENSNTWFTQAIALFEKHNIGWAWWPLKKLGFNNPLQIKSNTAVSYTHLDVYKRQVYRFINTITRIRTAAAITFSRAYPNDPAFPVYGNITNAVCIFFLKKRLEALSIIYGMP